MPREHGRVLSSIWRDDDFRRLSVEAQRLYVLLLSQSNVNNAGVLPLMVSKWSKGAESTTEDHILVSLSELAAARFVLPDFDTEEVFIRSYMRNDGIVKQPNIMKNALRCARALESSFLKAAVAIELRRLGRDDAKATADELDPSGSALEVFEKAFETLSEGFPQNARSAKPFRKGFESLRGGGGGGGNGSVSSYSLFGEAKKPERKRPATPIPDDWKPTATHRAKAIDRGVDVDHEAERMRNWALGKDERRVDWGATFHNWIDSARPRPRAVVGGQSNDGRAWQE